MDYTEEEVDEVFEEAVTLISSSKLPLSNDDMLLLYGYYKQANEGKCNTIRPGMLDFKGKAKWDAWNKLGEMSKVDAMKRYCEEIHRLVPTWDPWKNRAISKDTKKAGIAPTVSRPVDEEEDEATTICDFAASGNLNEVLAKLTVGVDVNWTDSEGRTALHMAVDRNNLEIVEFLIKHGANLNIQDHEGSTPLHYAALCEHKEMCATLLSHGADKNIRCASGEVAGDFYDFSNLN